MNERHNLSKAMKMVEILINKEMEYIFDEDGQLYYRSSEKSNNQLTYIETQEFKELCSFKYYDKYKDTLADTAYRQAINTLKGIKKQEIKERVKLNNRVAFEDGEILHQLSQENIVKITKDSVTIENDSPILFKTFKHQEPLPNPFFQNISIPDDNLDLIFEYANIDDWNQRLLFKVSLIFALIPNIPHPIDLLIGAPGSAKTTTSRIKKSLVDPVSSLKGFSIPRSETEFLLMASQHHVITFDNMPSISKWQSDMFCKAVTGDAISRRKLYTDNEQILYRVYCCLVLNGLEVPTIKSDFLDRTLLFSLERVPARKRREESKLFLEFENNKPVILGAMYKILSDTIGIYERIEVDELPRMADFGKWGCAITEAMGYDQKDFIQAYNENRKQIKQEMGSDYSLIEVIASYMNSIEDTRVSMTPTQLHSKLIKHANQKGISLFGFPSNATWLTRKLNEVANILEEEDILVTRVKNGDRRTILQKIVSYCPEPEEELNDIKFGSNRLVRALSAMKFVTH